MASKSILLLLAVYSCIHSVTSGLRRATKECPPGEFVDLNGNCAKRFRPKFKPCPDPEMSRFGSYEIKGGGRLVYFQCEEGWQLAPPNEHATCKMSSWDRDIPNCVRAGCRRLSTESDVRQERLLQGALVEFSCYDRAKIILGQKVLGCDGDKWNGTAPVCVDPPSTTVAPTTSESPTSPTVPEKKLSVTSGSSPVSVVYNDCFMLSLLLAACQQLRTRWSL